MWKKPVVATSVLSVALILAACGEDEPTGGEAGERPEELTIGVIPSEDQASVSDRMEEFTEELGTELDIDTEVFLGDDYNGVIEGMRNENVDIAFFGPFAYTLAKERSNAEVFAIGAEGEDDITYQSAIIVPADSEDESIEDLEGKDFLFVDPASTSGNIFPRAAVMEELGIEEQDEVDDFFENVNYSGGHDASILSVINGDVDGAAIATDVMNAMLDQGEISEEDYQIIDTSDDIPRGPDAYREELPDDLKEEIKAFYLNYEDENFFEERGISGFYEVSDEDFDIVRNTASTLNMSPEELLE
ncbi:phosphonate transport system substrate-binding protein [Salibacterium salarium]|uniref:Phosphate/phosphite/phosphonate ABC transporter substrate-binding protein n=1 Tax=Salibacterium salarium TaxID=284579 RepID=A0A428MVW6_9BACI|nr:phosphate/phosphite/phosphonate ABC transporter substrate-binding protein [Salibacterium salarium]MDQ0300557.1 phosphonate transport system substrate-binding protein [Salibacterium salarium]RSL30262.1 phosphate/phosphite/phosphonate ABC transporter substrate-binding protein [Salibacterium salarium]